MFSFTAILSRRRTRHYGHLVRNGNSQLPYSLENGKITPSNKYAFVKIFQAYFTVQVIWYFAIPGSFMIHEKRFYIVSRVQ